MRQIQTSDKKVEEAPEVIADTYSQPSADISRYQFPVMTIPGPPSGSDNKAHVGEAIDKVKIPGNNRVSFSTLRHVIRSIRQRDHRRERQSGFAIGHHEGWQEGWQKGYQAGLAEGRRAGYDKAARQQAEASEQWLALITKLWAELQGLHKSTLEHLGQPLVALVTRVVQQVVNHELSLSHNELQQLIEQSLEMLPNTDGLVIIINPEDRTLLAPTAEHWPDSWTIQEDNSLTPGGCRLVARQGEVDARVETRLKACLEPVGELLESQ